MMEDFRANKIRPKWGVKGTHFTSSGFIVEGVAYHVTPFNDRTIFDFFTPVGKASGILTNYLFYLGKRGFHDIHKIEDWIEVSPVHAQYYQLTMQQKQQLERQIKEGLASISQSVSDLELLLHDLRKYKEFLDYFEQLRVGGENAVKAEQTLKAIFVDEVDIHTDLPQTPIALRSIVSRWPTIIADFMILEDKDDDAKKIAAKLQVSEAEGVVLATKNKLYVKWKSVFENTVKGRYQRILELVKARERSVREYKNMLRPYIHRYRSIREMGETPETRGKLEETAFYRHAGQAVSLEYTKTWAWRPIAPAEFAKAARESIAGEQFDIKNWRRLPIGRGFKAMVAENLEFLKANDLQTISASPTGAEPLDDFVFQHYKKLEEHYDVHLSIADILKVRESFCKKDYNTFYFMTIEIGALRSIFKTPDGAEFEDLWLEPFHMYLDTQNVILLRMLEVEAKKKQEENYIKEMLGEVDENGKKLMELLETEYPHLFKSSEEKVWEKRADKKEEKKSKSIMDVLRSVGLDVAFFKRGPYETHFEDRVTGIWFPDMMASVYMPSVAMFKAYMQVPGFKVPT
jgi:hypothetical protein